MQVPMPTTVRVSLWLLIGTFVASTAAFLFDPAPFPAQPIGPAVLVGALVGLFVFFLFVYVAVMAYRRSNSARWTYAVVSVFSSLTSILVQIAKAPTLPTKISLDIFAAAQLISVALLFMRESNAWYSDKPSSMS